MIDGAVAPGGVERGDEPRARASSDASSETETLNDGAATEIASLKEAVRNLQGQLGTIQSLLGQERHRVDILLAGYEGILKEVNAFHDIRRSESYQKAFTSSKPLVTIIVGTMNRPDLLIDRCIRSIQAQSYDNLQVIVIGDHCTDDTEKRLAELRDSRISFTNLPQRGPYPRPGKDRWMVAGTHPGNEALKLVEGDFVTFLDDDDAYAIERIEILAEAAQREKADFLWHPFFWRQADEDWIVHGDGTLEHAQVGLCMTMYHAYLRRIHFDVHAYRLNEPGDWNLIRKLKALRPRMHFVNRPLTYYFKDYTEAPFIEQPGEEFIE